MEAKQQIQQKAKQFAKVARRYCETIESYERISPEDLLRTLHKVIPEAYFWASKLPEVEPESEGLLADPMTNDSWQKLYRSLGDKLGNYNLYWEVYDPTEREEHAPMASHLADDLADIYRDLNRGLHAVGSSNRDIAIDVVWDWRFGFTSHWGHHALIAMRTIHALMFEHELAEED